MLHIQTLEFGLSVCRMYDLQVVHVKNCKKNSYHRHFIITVAVMMLIVLIANEIALSVFFFMLKSNSKKIAIKLEIQLK